MAGEFTMVIGGKRVTAELLEREAPTVTGAFRRCLPFEAFGVHAKFAGDELIVMAPFFANPENEVFDVHPGDIGYYPGRQTMCIFYGDTQPFGHVSVFARVTGGFEQLRVVGRRILREGPLRVSVEDASRRKSKRPRSETPALRTLDRFLGRIWSEEPPEIAGLRSLERRPMGNLPCALYANFNTFWLGESVQVLRLQALERRVPVAQLNRLAAALLLRHASRLAKWRLTQTVRLLRTLAAYFEADGARNHTEFVAVAEGLMLSVDRVNAWIDAAIPWSKLDKKVALCRAPR